MTHNMTPRHRHALPDPTEEPSGWQVAYLHRKHSCPRAQALAFLAQTKREARA